MPQAIITLKILQAEAEQRGYLITQSGTDIAATKQQFEHVNMSFSLTDFDLKPQRAEEYGLLQAYYWVRGYHLNYGVDGKIELHRGMLHPQFDPQIRIATVFDYHYDGDWDLGKLHQMMLQWVELVEQPDDAGRRQTRTLKIEGTSRTYLV